MTYKDKNAFASKKFIAFFFSMLVIAGIIMTALFTQPFGWPMASFMVIGAVGLCGLAIGYILSQKSLDSFLSIIKDVIPNKDETNDSSENLE